MQPSGLALLIELIHSAGAHAFWFAWSGAVLLDVVLLCLGFRALHRARLMTDMPTAKLRSAAQGYVELEGWARMMPGEPVHAPLSGLPCAWYRYKIEKRERDAYGREDLWRTLESGTSEAIFHLEDPTGRCVVDPDGAEVIPSVRLCWRGHAEKPGGAPRVTGFWSQLWSTGPYRYTESRINDYDRLYAVGQFVGLGGHETASLNDEVRDLLTTWKRDRAALLRRFDADGDGEINLAEWEDARRDAESEVLARHAARPPQAEINLMKKPAYGRPYLLSCLSQETLVARARGRAGACLAGFLLLGATLVWTLRVRLD
ncbi:GIDE domain-containing protein [Methylococcus sp. EFPC2]|uniref:GIDE domain-containing protein n=1 Tax=Methylococcus sp. EFPC2 TaxID=2812648 RepID=UPI0019686ACB|nr:GIDE domain-containing protein [Methylococcus sp. EFPC2]QSA96280.1 hypothetical protein JWZ97_13750 [Methylococcus sp. EFPC2]